MIVVARTCGVNIISAIDQLSLRLVTSELEIASKINTPAIIVESTVKIVSELKSFFSGKYYKIIVREY